MRSFVLGALAVMFIATPARAEIKFASAAAMVIEHRFAMAATPAEAWQVLVHPERYWPSGHTWSGDARNLAMDPVAAGCFCERWADGSAEHGRIVLAIPGKLLRIRGSLGPFQEMAVAGVLTVALAAKEAGTEATVTYRITGDESHALAQMAPVVDAVVAQQFSGFAKLASAQP